MYRRVTAIAFLVRTNTNGIHRNHYDLSICNANQPHLLPMLNRRPCVHSSGLRNNLPGGAAQQQSDRLFDHWRKSWHATTLFQRRGKGIDNPGYIGP